MVAGASKLMNKISNFRGKYGFLSNFSPYQLDEYMEDEGIQYPSNEHFYQAQKFTDKNTKLRIASHPAKGLKAFCRKQEGFSLNWDNEKDEVMVRGLIYKFTLSRYRKLLLDTGDAEIEEGNSWGDSYWGIDSKKGGLNKLGKFLVELREGLKNNEADTKDNHSEA